MNGARNLKIILLVLFASLGLNVYYTAVQAGCWWRDGARQESRAEQWKKREEVLREKMSPEDFAVVQAQRKESKPKFKKNREILESARREVDKAMRAEPFDAGALAAALEAEKELKLEMLSQMRARREALSEKLSPEGRKTFKSVMQEKDLYRKMEESRRLQNDRPSPSSE